MPKIHTVHGDVTVCASPHRYELHTHDEAAFSEQQRHGNRALNRFVSTFDYITSVSDWSADQPRLVRYRGQWHDVLDMPMIPAVTPEGGALAALAASNWHTYSADSMWSATLCRFLDGDDEGFVRMGTATW